MLFPPPPRSSSQSKTPNVTYGTVHRACQFVLGFVFAFKGLLYTLLQRSAAPSPSRLDAHVRCQVFVTSHIRRDVGQQALLQARRRLEELPSRVAGTPSWAADGPDLNDGLGQAQGGTHVRRRGTHSRGQEGPRERHLRLVGKDNRKVVERGGGMKFACSLPKAACGRMQLVCARTKR